MARRKAVALAYERGDLGPRVLASGRGAAAEAMVRIARDAGIAVVEETALTELLEPLDPGSLVPGAYWETVAAVLAFAMRIEEERCEKLR